MRLLLARDIEHGLHMFCNLKLLVDPATEQVVCLARCDVALVSARAPSEPCRGTWLLMTTQRLYVLAQVATLAGDVSAGWGLSVASTHQWSSFSSVTVGLFMTWLRFEPVHAQSVASVACLSRSHAFSHGLLHAASGAIPGFPARVQTVRASVSAMQKLLFFGSAVDLRSYAHVQLHRKRTLLWDTHESKSLVLTPDVLVLCDEDFGRWFGTGPLLSAAVRAKVGDVASVTLEPTNECAVSIEFDSEIVSSSSSGLGAAWLLEFASTDDRSRFVDVLAALWSLHMGGIALAINTRTV